MSREDLLIVVDVGNTNTVCGVFQGDKFIADFRLSTDVDRTADEYAALLLPLLASPPRVSRPPRMPMARALRRMRRRAASSS